MKIKRLEVSLFEFLRHCLGILYSGHTGEVYTVASCTVNGKTLLITGSGDDTAHIVDTSTGELFTKLSKHGDSVIQVETKVSTVDQKLYIATASMDGTIKIYTFNETFELIHTLDGPTSEIESFSFHKTHDALVAGSADGTIWLWDCKSGECLNVFAGHSNSVTCSDFTPNGKRVVSSSADTTTRIWNPSDKSNNLLHTFQDRYWHSSPIITQAFHSAQDFSSVFATGGQNGKIIIAKLDSKKIIQTFNHSENSEIDQICSIEALSFSQDKTDFGKSILVSGATNGYVLVWNWKLGTIRGKFSCAPDLPALTKLRFIGESINIFATTNNGNCCLIDCRASQVLSLLDVSSETIFDFIYDENLNFLLAVGNEIKLVNTR